MATLLNTKICGARYHLPKPGEGSRWPRANIGRAL